jgi:hypothetical protein
MASGFWAENYAQRGLAEPRTFAAERAPCRVLIIQKCVYDAQLLPVRIGQIARDFDRIWDQRQQKGGVTEIWTRIRTGRNRCGRGFQPRSPQRAWDGESVP